MSALKPGQMSVTILDDGTVRMETGDMGGVTHKAADDFLKEVQRLLGGAVEVKSTKGQAHHHHHDHEHGHDHQHGGH